MFQNGLLVLRASNALHRVSPLSVIQRCSELIKKTLYVHLVNDDVDFTDVPNATPSVPLIEGVRSYITDFYTNASHVVKSLDVRFFLANISNHPNSCFKAHQLRHGYDVILTDFSCDRHQKLRCYVATLFPSSACETKVLQGLGDLVDSKLRVEKVACEAVETYDAVVLGGTFDRLHVGHKILLSEGCLLCDKKLTVGVTDGNMNKRKILPELMQTTPDRIHTVSDFLLDVKPNIAYHIVPITDIYGPSTTDNSLQCLVVSRETIRGWELINAKRKAQRMLELELDVIELVEDLGHASEEEEKVSSSTSRIRLLGTLLRSPKIQGSYDRRPFVIGLTGGTASGKTSIGKRLQKLGAGIIDCDALGHRSYLPESPTFERVVEAFGEDIVDSKGFIDRRILGSKVFASKEQMNRLNAIVWPAIAQLAAEEVKALADKGTEVIVLDAAVLLEAGWDAMVDEVWTTVIPTNEAVKRLVERNHLTEEAAQQRLHSQISNEDRVSRADVVLCTFWAPEVTQKQVEKAWTLLQQRLHPGVAASTS